MKKVRKFEQMMKESKPIIFNANVFKTNVKLAMTPEEIKIEEDKVMDLAKYLKDTAIGNFIKNF